MSFIKAAFSNLSGSFRRVREGLYFLYLDLSTSQGSLPIKLDIVLGELYDIEGV